ncbi:MULTISPECIES: ROK family glucokinase [unclassified Virgibacillus]|uniref:ROK family glucokinase n=1 Tax=unclassified Virgibacillus TaxID=2620237 RepID=UPI0024DE0F26|nr:ROK family glucokinase [Virgibacillus sp. LDC-1]
MKQITVGIDIGGTSVKIGFINETGEILHKWQIATNKANGGKFIVDEIWSSIQAKLSEKKWAMVEIRGIGVGAPGFIDAKTGMVYEAVNIGWKNFDLGDQLKKQSQLPVYVENDANIAVLGENWVGAGKHANNLIAITLGTGVGGGIIAEGKILSGENGTAGEIGHITIDPEGSPCNCGRKGCLETIASATGIVRQAIEVAENQPSGKLAAILQGKGYISTKDVFACAAEGDKESQVIIQHITDAIGFAIANLAILLNPSKVLIGGGVSQAGDTLLTYINEAFQKYALPRVFDVCELALAQLGNDAGIIGAAYLVHQQQLTN